MTTEQFHYEINGQKITLPHVRNLPFGLIRKLRKESDEEQFFGLIEQVADPDTLALIDTLDIAGFQDLTTKWQEASQVAVGESSASSDT